MKYENEAGKREKRGKTFLLLRGGLRMGKKDLLFSIIWSKMSLHSEDQNINNF